MSKQTVSTRAKEQNMPIAPKLKAPEKTVNAFSAFVAAQKAAEPAKEPATVVSEPVAAEAKPAKPPAFVHTVRNGRKDYKPGTIGRRIWDAADALQAVTPGTPVTIEAMRLALPDVCEGSLSSGSTHWRQFHGTLHVAAKSLPKKVEPASVVVEHMGPPAPPWAKTTALV